jgi:antitoxin (DNA-binding transcriptional repressor) of toxin-antitoxin stability system
MEVPITEFRRKLFALIDQALNGDEVWVRHKGRRVRIVAEQAPSKLSRITPMDIIVPGADLEDDSWKADMMREWEEKWRHRLAPLSKPVTGTSTPVRSAVRKTRRKA